MRKRNLVHRLYTRALHIYGESVRAQDNRVYFNIMEFKNPSLIRPFCLVTQDTENYQIEGEIVGKYRNGAIVTPRGIHDL